MRQSGSRRRARSGDRFAESSLWRVDPDRCRPSAWARRSGNEVLGMSSQGRREDLRTSSDALLGQAIVVVVLSNQREPCFYGIDLDRPQDEESVDPLANESPPLAGIAGASVVGRIASGARSGQTVERAGRKSDATLRAAIAERQAHLGGFDLHAGVAVPAGDRERLEHLCRYALRPPVAQDALELTADGKVLLRMRRPWHDGTRAILFEPHELIERLADLVPKPRINLLLYHGVFGRARACERARLHPPRRALVLTSLARPSRSKSGSLLEGRSPCSGTGRHTYLRLAVRPMPTGRMTPFPDHPANAGLLQSLGVTRRGRSFCAARSRSTSLPAPNAEGGCACLRPSRTRRW